MSTEELLEFDASWDGAFDEEWERQRQTIIGSSETADSDEPIQFPAPADARDEGDERSPVADLVAIAQRGELFHTPEGVPFASFRDDNHRETWPVRSGGFREWLSAHYFDLTGKSPSSTKMLEALLTIAGLAKHRGETRKTFLRIAPLERSVYIDLGARDWRAIEITENAWRVVAEPPVRFWRSASMLALPEPVAGGDLLELRSFMNVSDDDAWHLLVGWLVMAFSPTGPYPVAVLHGEQGSAKSTAEKMLRSLIDPSQSPLRATPKDNQDLLIACKNGWVIAYDNLSHVEDWQKAEAEAQLVALPDNNKLVMFDRHRTLAASLPDAIAAATPDKVQELVALLVERVETANQRVARVTWVPAARPFFRDAGAEAEEDAALLWRPRRESNSRRRP